MKKQVLYAIILALPLLYFQNCANVDLEKPLIMELKSSSGKAGICLERK